MTDRPKRFESRPTVALDRNRIISEVARKAFNEGVREEQDQVDTQEACPDCQACKTCGGTHMVTRERAKKGTP
jgi:hypothetical protein